MKNISYSQNFEDIMLWRALSSVQSGFYIDVGASEPVADSVTAFFYERGWSGINIEPMEGAFHRLNEARERDINLQLALEEKPGTALYFSVEDGNGISTGNPELGEKYQSENWKVRKVPVVVQTLKSICEKYARNREIHFLKIDVEGKEREVLRGGDFLRFRPWIVLVEATRPNSQIPTHQEWEDILLSQDYLFAYFDGLNRFYISREKMDQLGSHFRAPPNWFDNFIKASEIDLKKQLDDVEFSKQALSKKVLELENQIKNISSEYSESHAGWRLEKNAREELETRIQDTLTDNREIEKRLSLQLSTSQRLEQDLEENQAKLEAAQAIISKLTKTNEQLLSQTDAYYQEAFESSRHIAWLSRERTNLGQKLAVAEAAQRALRETQENQIAELRVLNSTLQAQEERHANETRAREGDHASQIKAIFQTFSWRVTRPLRFIRKITSSTKKSKE